MEMEHGFAHEGGKRRTWDETFRAEPHSYANASQGCRTPDGYVVHLDLPDNLPVTSEEIALLRAFLSDEIRAILHGEDQER